MFRRMRWRDVGCGRMVFMTYNIYVRHIAFICRTSMILLLRFSFGELGSLLLSKSVFPLISKVWKCLEIYIIYIYMCINIWRRSVTIREILQKKQKNHGVSKHRRKAQS